MTEEQADALRHLAGPMHRKTEQGWSETGLGPFISEAMMNELVALGYAEIGDVFGDQRARITKAGRIALRP